MDFRYVLLTIVTASRWLCVPLWTWLWFRKSSFATQSMRLSVVAWFLGTDFHDGRYARVHGLTSSLGRILDHGADVLFTLTVVILAISGSAIRGRRGR